MTLVRLILNDVPNECIMEIKRVAAITVDRYYHRMNENIGSAVLAASNIKKDAFRVANGLAKQYLTPLKDD